MTACFHYEERCYLSHAAKGVAFDEAISNVCKNAIDGACDTAINNACDNAIDGACHSEIDDAADEEFFHRKQNSDNQFTVMAWEGAVFNGGHRCPQMECCWRQIKKTMHR